MSVVINYERTKNFYDNNNYEYTTTFLLNLRQTKRFFVK